jgi:hypothetical protein
MNNYNNNTCLLLGLDVVEDNVEGSGLLSEIGDNGDGAADSLADSAISVELGKTNPLAELSTSVSHDEGNRALGAESLDKSGVLIIVAVLGKDAKSGGTSVKCLGAPKISERVIVSSQRRQKIKNRVKVEHC